MKKKIGLSLFSLLLPVSLAAAQPRLDYSNPVFGGAMRVVVDHAIPNAEISLSVFLDNGDSILDPTELLDTRNIGRADASGTVRYEFELREAALLGLAGDGGDVRVILVASDNPTNASRVSAPVPVRIERSATLLITGVDERGEAWLYEWGGDQAEPNLAIPLGFGRPGGAVRDGRHSSVFVISDADQGIVTEIRRAANGDDPVVVRDIALAPDLRGITVSPDGRHVLVTAAASGSSVLFVIDARAAGQQLGAVTPISIDPLGPDGGRLAVSDDGLSAFIVVQGLYIRQVNLLHGVLGYLLAVGDPGQSHIRDLRIVQGNLFALTGRPADARPSDSITGLDIADLHSVEQLSRLVVAADLGAGMVNGGGRSLAPAILALQGGGSVTVIDARTMQRRFDFSVPRGAEALLFTPDPTHTQVALLYGEPGAASFVRWVDLAGTSGPVIGDRQDVGFPARVLLILGTSPRIHRTAVFDDLDRAWLLSDLINPQLVPLPAGVRVVAVSVQ